MRFSQYTFILLGAIHKDVRTESQKIDPLVRADTPQISKKPMIFAPKNANVHIWRTPSSLARKMSALNKAPWLRTSFMDDPLRKYR